jgi:hypothetical protein
MAEINPSTSNCLWVGEESFGNFITQKEKRDLLSGYDGAQVYHLDLVAICRENLLKNLSST